MFGVTVLSRTDFCQIGFSAKKQPVLRRKWHLTEKCVAKRVRISVKSAFRQKMSRFSAEKPI
jgi:hypothetical protein